MRVLVTGGAGFIGSHITDALLERGHEVAVVDDLSSGKRAQVPAAARFHQHDIRDAAAVRRVCDQFRPEVVCHQAAQVSVAVSVREPVLDAATNVIGTLNVLEAARAAGVGRVVFASTGGAIYGEVPEPERAAPARAPHAISPYAAAKLSVEAYLEVYRCQFQLDYRILRYANVYGPRQDPHGEAGVVAIFAARLLAAKPLSVFARATAGDPGCVRDYVYVGDVVRANVAAIEGDVKDRITNVATGVGTTTLEIANGLAGALGVTPQIEYGPQRPGDLERSVLEPAPWMGALVGLTEGLGETARWFAAQGRAGA